MLMENHYYLRLDTTVSLRWLNEPLAMGRFTWVSQAINQPKRRPNWLQERLRCRLVRGA